MNKRRRLLVFVCIAIVPMAFLFAVTAPRAADPTAQTKEFGAKVPAAVFMRAKLASSKDVLEGLITEDFGKIKRGADQMTVMSNAAQWQVIQGPTYTQHSAEFRRIAAQLSKAADDKSIDAAYLCYVQLTLSCIDCHKYVKGTRVAMHVPFEEGRTVATRVSYNAD